MSKAILLQQIYRRTDAWMPEWKECGELIALTYGRNLDYCGRHGIDYEVTYGDVVPNWKLGQGGWAKLALIMRALDMGYQHVIWMDADALIADLTADLRDGCPTDAGLGMVRNLNPYPHYNVGMIYATNSVRTRELMEYWCQFYPGAGTWHEQSTINLLARMKEVNDWIRSIDFKWNSCVAGGTSVDHPVVAAFHGEGDYDRRLLLMKECLADLRWPQTEKDPHQDGIPSVMPDPQEQTA